MRSHQGTGPHRRSGAASTIIKSLAVVGPPTGPATQTRCPAGRLHHAIENQ